MHMCVTACMHRRSPKAKQSWPNGYPDHRVDAELSWVHRYRYMHTQMHRHTDTRSRMNEAMNLNPQFKVQGQRTRNKHTFSPRNTRCMVYFQRYFSRYGQHPICLDIGVGIFIRIVQYSSSSPYINDQLRQHFTIE